MGAHRYRKARSLMLAVNDICALCGHPGARTADHIIRPALWLAMYGTRDGCDDIDNLQPAHGTAGNRLTGTINRCGICGKLCNQSRGAKPIHTPRSRDWYGPND